MRSLTVNLWLNKEEDFMQDTIKEIEKTLMMISIEKDLHAQIILSKQLTGLYLKLGMEAYRTLKIESEHDSYLERE